eukprot:5980678-Pyramimonas_sp.AAC.1
MLCCAVLCYALLCYAVLCYAKARQNLDEDEISNAKLGGRSWGNRGADPGGTTRGEPHCPAL